MGLRAGNLFPHWRFGVPARSLTGYIDAMKSLFLIRHAEAEFAGRGRGDHGRRLTADGLVQANRLGQLLADAGVSVVLTSSADRALQTAHGMALSADIEVLDELYNGSTTTIVRALADLDDRIKVAAVVAHAPGIGALAADLAGPGSELAAQARINSHFPTATVARIDFDGPWAAPLGTRLTWAARG